TVKTEKKKEQKTEQNLEDGKPEEQKVTVDNLKVTMLSPTKVTQNDLVEFEISYDVLEDIEAHPVFSMTDIDRNIWIYNDN
ncbi:ABC transporter ATP-binding protein, partial [Streptococcus pyogenes]